MEDSLLTPIEKKRKVEPDKFRRYPPFACLNCDVDEIRSRTVTKKGIVREKVLKTQARKRTDLEIDSYVGIFLLAFSIVACGTIEKIEREKGKIKWVHIKVEWSKYQGLPYQLFIPAAQN